MIYIIFKMKRRNKSVVNKKLTINNKLKNIVKMEEIEMKKYEIKNNPAGNLLEEINEQDFSLNVSGGYDSEGLGTRGGHCSMTRECQRICNWVSYGSGGFFGC